ncbi:hypothetical protein [Nafulsella turpanensis]|uniref:hypothetical protein n=1 Tax=Nafulsella turpanensis TaxID=1265690 RepID=UPI0003736C9A|nr:hypothetical protein [Nafulsella turpanensis]
MKIIKKTFQAMVLNLLIIASFFVFVNCFNKQELWPVVVSGSLLMAFILMKVSMMSKANHSTQQRYYR